MVAKVLLIEDIENFGKKGEIACVKPGFARNYLIPQKKALYADAYTLRLQARLQAERAKQSAVEKKESQVQAKTMETKSYSVKVKVDTQGHMYGSVSAVDLMRLLQEDGFDSIHKKQLVLSHPIKKLGVYNIPVKLKEGVMSSFQLKVLSEVPIPSITEEVTKDTEEEQSKDAEAVSEE